jgi:hypothetical protein
MQRELLRNPYLLEYIQPEQQTAKLVDKLISKEPFVIEYVREDLRTPELIQKAINTWSLTTEILDRLGIPYVPPPKREVHCNPDEDEPINECNESDKDEDINNSEESHGPKVEYFEDGFDVGFTREKWDAMMKIKNIQMIKEAIEHTPSIYKFLNNVAFDLLASQN